MYPKNTSSPRRIYAKVVSATDGSPLTADVVAYHIQADTRGAVGGTAAAHIANGLWGYTPTQPETDYDAFAIEFYHTGAVADGPVVEVVTTDLGLINAEVDTALADINLDHLAKTGDATLTNIVADNTIFAHLMAIGADISDYSDATDSLEAQADRGVDILANTAVIGTPSLNPSLVAAVEGVGSIMDYVSNLGVVVASVGASAIGAASLANNTITADKIANNAITAAKINTDAITADKIADDAIGNEHWNVTAVTGCVLGNTAHGGAAASLTLADYSDFTGATASNPNVLLTAEIAAVSDQTHFTLATGSDQDDAYNDQAIALYDDSNSDYPCVRVVVDYTGATKTVQIDSAPVFTLGEDDSVNIFATAPGTTAPTAAQVADAVWDEAQADHTDTATFGLYLDAKVSEAGGGSGGDATLANQQAMIATLSTIEGYVDCLPPSWVTVPTVAQIWTTQLTEAYSTAGAAPTAAQALCELLAMRNTQIVDTTRTAYKLDGTTPAMTLTLSMDADNKPYKQSRAT